MQPCKSAKNYSDISRRPPLISSSATPNHSHERLGRRANTTSTESTLTNTTWLPSYDYVIVGSGPGGGPLAARLAIAGFSVLLLDAGSDQGSSYQEQVPALQLMSTEYEPMRWDYFVNHYQNETRQELDSKMVWEVCRVIEPLSAFPAVPAFWVYFIVLKIFSSLQIRGVANN